MSSVQRVRAVLQGLPGLPGVSTFYAVDAGSLIFDLVTFYTAIKGGFPTGLTVTVQDSGETINDVDGKAIGAWTATGQGGVVNGSGGGAFVSPTGAVVSWTTGAFINGRRVKGRTFLVPLVTGSFDNGSITADSLSIFRQAAGALVTSQAGNMLVLSQPYKPPLGSTNPRRDGSSHPVTGSDVPDLAAVLRSRRD